MNMPLHNARLIFEWQHAIYHLLDQGLTMLLIRSPSSFVMKVTFTTGNMCKKEKGICFPLWIYETTWCGGVRDAYLEQLLR